MRPYFLGGPARRLYAAYHAAAASPNAPRAAVLCYSWGPEYDHAHRAMRQLATSLAAAGVHALRFDYYGAGDSGGDGEEGDLEGWSSDGEAALDELREISGAAQVVLIGLRIGAMIAATIADRRRDDVEALILWDPIMSRDYLRDMEDAALERLGTAPEPRQSARGGYEIFGHDISAAMATGFQHLDTTRTVERVTAPMSLVISGDEAMFAQTVAAIGRERLRAAVHVPARPCWADDGVLSSGFVPLEVINAIVHQVA